MTSTDFEAITRRLYEYAYGIDGRDWDLYRSVFTDQIDVDFSSWNESPASTVPVETWLAQVKPLFVGLDATQHSMSNPLVDIDASGTSARCRMYMQAAHFLNDWPEPEFTIGGYYDDRLVRVGDQWQISAVTLNVWWRRGDETLMVEAAKRGKSC